MKSIKMRRLIKWIFISAGLGFLISLGFLTFVFFSVSGLFDPFHSYQELLDNYKSRTREIYELRDYINSIVSDDKNVDIEFENNKTLAYFHIVDDGKYYSNWDLKIKSGKVDTLLQILGWTNETLKTLNGKLNDANCISIAKGNPCKIGFQRSGMGMYFYNLFDKPIPDSLMNNYNDSCTYILFNRKVVFEYGGGVLGPQCFPDFKH